MLEVRHLVKRFGGATALHDIDLDVAKGECCALVGPNGAGKSTLLRIVAGALAASGGRIRIAGIDAARDPFGARRLTGFVPENAPLYDDLRVTEYLHYRGRLKGLRGRRLRARERQLIERCGLGEVRHQLIERLSLGMRSRVSLADALLHEPALLLLDEPFAALDPMQLAEGLALLVGAARQSALLLATQRLDLVEPLRGRLVVLNRGRIVADGARAAAGGAAPGALCLEIAGGEPAAARQLLGGVAGIGTAEIDRLPDGWLAVRCATVAASDTRAELAAAVLRAGWRLRELRPVDAAPLRALRAALGTPAAGSGAPREAS